MILDSLLKFSLFSSFCSLALCFPTWNWLQPAFMPFTALHRFGPSDLNPNEEIIYRARLNFVAFMIFGSRSFFALLFGVILTITVLTFRNEIGFFEVESITLGISLFLGSFLLYSLYRFSIRLVDWLYDEDIITDQRVIDYNQKYLFSRDQTTANMKGVQHITLVQNGFIRNFFNYGSLQVHTVGGNRVALRDENPEHYLIIENISKPKQVQRLIDEISYRAKREVAIDKDEVLKACGLGG